MKSLDTKTLLYFELINKAIYWTKKYHGVKKEKWLAVLFASLEVNLMISDYKLNTDVIVLVMQSYVISKESLLMLLILGKLLPTLFMLF